LLGVVTEATLKLIPLPPYRAALSVGFGTSAQAIRALRDILRAGFLPCALEIADEFTLQAARRRTGSGLFDDCRAHLIVELDGQPASVRGEMKIVERLVRASHPTFVVSALGARQCERIWRVRREFSYALRDTGLTKLNQDIVVPRGRLRDLFAFVKKLQKRHGLPIAAFGHAGDGNIHVNVMVDLQAKRARTRAQTALDDLFAQVLAWQGVITGEHGIGLAKKRWWPWAAPAALRGLHRRVKDALDPNGILNPGKFV
jgi:glycolate oxidase